MDSLRFLDESRSGAFRHLFPIRPLQDLLYGGFTFDERWRLALGGAASAAEERSLHLFVNPIGIPGRSIEKTISGAEGEERLFTAGGKALAALVRDDRAGAAVDGILPERAWRDLSDSETEGSVVATPWEMIGGNPERIVRDTELFSAAGDRPDIPAVSAAREGPPLHGVEIVGRGGLYIGEGARIEPFVLLDTTEGPIWIGARTVVEAHTTIRGPLWLRNDTRVKGAARIGDGTTVGEGSRVAGEIETTVFGAFSNKQHEGFLGHAYVGEWVNLGAGTNNSDLKNNYGPVRIDWGEGPSETGENKLGCFLGDHVKSAIGTRIGTGTVAGTASNLFGPTGLVTGFIPPFSWGEGGDLYDFDRAVDTMKVVRKRRAAELERAGRRILPDEREYKILRELWEKRGG